MILSRDFQKLGLDPPGQRLALEIKGTHSSVKGKEKKGLIGFMKIIKISC